MIFLELRMHKTKTLVVDDEEVTRKKHKNVLESIGCEVLLASTAEEALDMLKQDNDIEAVFTDYLMPGKSGYELAKEGLTINKGIVFAVVTQFYESEFTNENRPHVDRLLKKPLNKEAALGFLDDYGLKPSSKSLRP